MTIKWCHNAKTGEIFSYQQIDDWNDFPRGTWLTYRDYLTTGMASKVEAEEWARLWHVCPTCEDVHKGSIGDPCPICRTPLVGPG